MGSRAVRQRSDELQDLRLADPRISRLRQIVDCESLLRGDFTLSSGRRSNYLFQLRQTTLHPEGACLIGELIIEFMKQHELTCVGGLELGAVPIVTAVAQSSFILGYPVAAFFVRKESKAHGARERIDGYLREDAEILIVDDVTTSGGSMLQAIAAIQAEGRQCRVRKALSIVDRLEGAKDRLASEGIALYSLLNRTDFQI